MYKHVLIPTDGSELSANAEAAGLTLARSLDAKVTVLTVTPPFQLVGTEPMLVIASEPEYEKAQAERAAKTLERVKATAAAIGVPVETVRMIHAHPHEAIIAAAQEHGCDLVFMASHGRRGISALLLGSETSKVLTHCKVPVLVYR